MALKVTDEGFIVIKTKKDAVAALTKFQTLKAERDEAYEEAGIKDMDEELVALKAAVTNFMKEKEMETIECKGFHGTMVTSYYGGHWIGTKDDITDDDPAGARSLKSILQKKFGVKAAKPIWMRITKRVPDHQAIEEAIAEGVFTVKDVAPAWSEKQKAPYLRIFEDS